MKLKNKISGEIKEFALFDGNELQGGATLESLTKEWEDYEEPKEFWYINEFGTPTKADFVGRETLYDKCRKNFGNYFETKEEAEKAVEKLKAFRRLRNLGFEFKDWRTNASCKDAGVVETTFNLWADLNPEIVADLDLLFGGEE